jgi:hypothetical protein
MNPARELARQTFDVLKNYAECIEKAGGARLCIALCMGQTDLNQYTRGHEGIHVMVATAGKLMGNLKTKRFNLDVCRYFCLDEADRMIDLDQEEDIRTIFSYFKGQRQTVLFSATMPAKIRDFAKSALINHLVRCAFSDRNLHSRMPLDPTEVNMHVTNGIPLGCSLLLPVGTVNSATTLKAITIGRSGAANLDVIQEVEYVLTAWLLALFNEWQLLFF